MSLFPAYGQGEPLQDYLAVGEYIILEDDIEEPDVGEDLSPAAECALLAEPQFEPKVASPPTDSAQSSDFYFDKKLDRGNLPVSTLYYPARPEYRARDAAALGVNARTVRASRGDRDDAAARRGKRYWRRAADCGASADAARELADRGAAFRKALDDAPHDEDLWIRYIDFLEWCSASEECKEAGGAESAATVATQAYKLNPDSTAIHVRLHAALRRELSPRELAQRLKDMLHDESRSVVRAELWSRAVSALACCGELEGARSLAVAATRDRSVAALHHNVLHVFGCILRSAGLWEQLVQLIELVAAMNFPNYSGFPPPRDEEKEIDAEKQLLSWEAGCVSSGLPQSAVWARVERARAALHWREPSHRNPLELAADPQRAPPRDTFAELLQPAPNRRAAFRLLVTLLRLAETPLLPAAGYVARAVAGSDPALQVSWEWEASVGVSLGALVRCARRLPPAHPARAALSPRACKRLLACTPLMSAASHATGTTGFGAWQVALWEAALEWTFGARRVALLCWRLRVLHARLLTADTTEEIRSIRAEARECLRRWAGEEALPFVVFARIEAACSECSSRGLRAGLKAARQALHTAAASGEPAHTHTALYAARVVWELCAESGDVASGTVGQWALLCAATGRPLPPDEDLKTPPPRAQLEAAAEECFRRCSQLEERYSSNEHQDEDDEMDVEAAFLPSPAEWGCIRALIAPPHLHSKLTTAIRATGWWRHWEGARYREQSASALAVASARQHRAAAVARILAPLAPYNAYLALLSAGAAPWEAVGAGERGLSHCSPRTEMEAWAALLPALLRAAGNGWPPEECRLVERGCRRGVRVRGVAGAPLLHALRLDAAVDSRSALAQAITEAPHSKWVLLRGCAVGAGDVGTLADLALERGLRLHALPDELTPLLPTPSTNEDTTQANMDIDR